MTTLVVSGKTPRTHRLAGRACWPTGWPTPELPSLPEVAHTLNHHRSQHPKFATVAARDTRAGHRRAARPGRRPVRARRGRRPPGFLQAGHRVRLFRAGVAVGRDGPTAAGRRARVRRGAGRHRAGVRRAGRLLAARHHRQRRTDQRRRPGPAGADGPATGADRAVALLRCAPRRRHRPLHGRGHRRRRRRRTEPDRRPAGHRPTLRRSCRGSPDKAPSRSSSWTPTRPKRSSSTTRASRWPATSRRARPWSPACPTQVDAVIAAVTAQERFARRVNMEVASHTALMDPVLPDIRAALADLTPRTPTIPFLSTVTDPAVEPTLRRRLLGGQRAPAGPVQPGHHRRGRGNRHLRRGERQPDPDVRDQRHAGDRSSPQLRHAGPRRRRHADLPHGAQHDASPPTRPRPCTSASRTPRCPSRRGTTPTTGRSGSAQPSSGASAPRAGTVLGAHTAVAGHPPGTPVAGAAGSAGQAVSQLPPIRRGGDRAAVGVAPDAVAGRHRVRSVNRDRCAVRLPDRRRPTPRGAGIHRWRHHHRVLGGFRRRLRHALGPARLGTDLLRDARQRCQKAGAPGPCRTCPATTRRRSRNCTTPGGSRARVPLVGQLPLVRTGRSACRRGPAGRIAGGAARRRGEPRPPGRRVQPGAEGAVVGRGRRLPQADSRMRRVPSTSVRAAETATTFSSTSRSPSADGTPCVDIRATALHRGGTGSRSAARRRPEPRRSRAGLAAMDNRRGTRLPHRPMPRRSRCSATVTSRARYASACSPRATTAPTPPTPVTWCTSPTPPARTRDLDVSVRLTTEVSDLVGRLAGRDARNPVTLWIVTRGVHEAASDAARAPEQPVGPCRRDRRRTAATVGRRGRFPAAERRSRRRG